MTWDVGLDNGDRTPRDPNGCLVCNRGKKVKERKLPSGREARLCEECGIGPFSHFTLREAERRLDERARTGERLL